MIFSYNKLPAEKGNHRRWYNKRLNYEYTKEKEDIPLIKHKSQETDGRKMRETVFPQYRQADRIGITKPLSTSQVFFQTVFYIYITETGSLSSFIN